MKFGRLTVLAGALVAIVSLSAGCKPSPQAVTVGAILPLTGDGAKYGEEARNGIDLALSETAGDKIKIIYEDDLGTATGAVNAFNKLASANAAPAIIGPMYSSTAKAIAPLAQQKKIVLFSPSASDPALSGVSEYIFRNWPSDVFEGGEMARYARDKLGLKRIAILAVNLDYGRGLVDVFRKAFEASGGTVPLVEFYDQGATDFRTQLTKIAAANPDAVYLPGYYTEIGLALRQARELELRAQFLSSVGFDNPKVLEIAGKAADGVVFARPYYDPDGDDAVTKKFVETFKAKFQRAPGVYAAHAYDATRILGKVIEAGATSAEAIRQGLRAIKDFPGVTGATTFDASGDVIKPIQIMKVESGEFRHVR